MRNLLDGMPPEARSKRTNPDEPSWGFTEELLAQVVEEVSVLAANYRRKEPRTVRRPGALAPKRPKHGGLLDAAMKRGAGRVRVVGT